jgi:hypothetical protein
MKSNRDIYDLTRRACDVVQELRLALTDECYDQHALHYTFTGNNAHPVHTRASLNPAHAGKLSALLLGCEEFLKKL